MHHNALALLRLLQLVSPALPVGAYTYSEGLETLVQQETIATANHLQQWLTQELQYGTIRIEAVILREAYDAAQQLATDFDSAIAQLNHWNNWLSAFRETSEIREQSWQMGRSLIRLLQDLQPDTSCDWNARAVAILEKIDLEKIDLEKIEPPINFAISFAIAAAHWQIDRSTTILGYLQSWAANLVNAGVRLIPLGQTQGQQMIQTLAPEIVGAMADILQIKIEDVQACNWGVAIASMNHESLYSRLFRS
jgi:urease accessory protein